MPALALAVVKRCPCEAVTVERDDVTEIVDEASWEWERRPLR